MKEDYKVSFITKILKSYFLHKKKDKSSVFFLKMYSGNAVTESPEKSAITTTIIIIVKNKKEKTCTLIEVAKPADKNVVQKEAEKKLKYKSLCIEIQRMWNLKCTIIPIIIGAIGIVTRNLRKSFVSCNSKTFDRFITKDSYTWNITHNTESTAV